MIKVLSDAGHAVYSRLAKPVLFNFRADSVHESMVSSGLFLQEIPLFRDATRNSLRYDDPILETTIAGVSFKTPLGLSAGLDKDAKLLKVMEAIGFGFEECGSVTFLPYGGNAQPWYTRLPASNSIVVNSGLRSEGAKAVIDRIGKIYDPQFLSEFPLNVSIARTNVRENCDPAEGVMDYCKSFELFEKSGFARMYTLNISCPNTFGGEPFTTPDLLRQLLVGVQSIGISRPVFIKLPIDKPWSETRKLLAVAAEFNFVTGITIGNLYKDRATARLADPLPDSVKGNLSGKPCWEPSNRLLEAGYREFGKRFVFIGVGGVFTAEDAYHKIRLGASLVEMVTGLIFQGPACVGRINKQLAELLRRDGFGNISEAVGVDNTK